MVKIFVFLRNKRNSDARFTHILGFFASLKIEKVFNSCNAGDTTDTTASSQLQYSSVCLRSRVELPARQLRSRVIFPTIRCFLSLTFPTVGCVTPHNYFPEFSNFFRPNVN